MINLATLYKQYDQSLPSIFLDDKPKVRLIKTVKARQYVKPMNYTKSKREQLICADMSSAIVIVYLEMPTVKHPQKVLYLIHKIKRQLDKIYEVLYGCGNLVLKPRILKRYQSTIRKIQDLIHEAWGEEAGLSLEFIAAVLQITIDMNERVKSKPLQQSYVAAWQKLVDTLQELYEHYDSDLSLEDCIERGSKFGDKLWDIIRES